MGAYGTFEVTPPTGSTDVSVAYGNSDFDFTAGSIDPTSDDQAAALRQLCVASWSVGDDSGVFATMTADPVEDDSSDDDSSAGLSSSDTDSSVTPAPAPSGPVLDPTSNLPLYVHDTTPVVDPQAWPVAADVTGPAGETLYTFTGDTAGAAPTGVGGPWTLFEGTTTPVSGS